MDLRIYIKKKRALLVSLNITKIFALISIISFGITNVRALPWDTDLYNQQSLKSNEVVRAPVKGTVPVGYKPFTMTIEEAEKSLSNPVTFDKNSVWRGQRLWNAQCSACHGNLGDSSTKAGKLLGAPNLKDDRFKAYSDGRVYATIVNGIRAMPRYGYKLSDPERWDVVNYLKFLQGKEVSGVIRPVQED